MGLILILWMYSTSELDELFLILITIKGFILKPELLLNEHNEPGISSLILTTYNTHCNVNNINEKRELSIILTSLMEM